MILKLFVSLVVIVAIAVGVLSLTLPRDQIVHLVIFRDFFDVSLPILGFGALVKYLCSCCRSCNCAGACCCKKAVCNTANKTM